MSGPLCKEALTLRAEFTKAMALAGQKGKRFLRVCNMIWDKAEKGHPYFVGIVVDLFADKQAIQQEVFGDLNIHVKTTITREKPKE